MQKEATIIIAEDDKGHATLIKRNLVRAGIKNRIIEFVDGQEVLDFLFSDEERTRQEEGTSYLLLLDIRMPKMDGIDVLQRIKKDEVLRSLPVIMISTTDDPKDIARCHQIGCSNYITKPVDYEKFIAAIQRLGFFLLVVQVPTIKRDSHERESK